MWFWGYKQCTIVVQHCSVAIWAQASSYRLTVFGAHRRSRVGTQMSGSDVDDIMGSSSDGAGSDEDIVGSAQRLPRDSSGLLRFEFWLKGFGATLFGCV
jgi:hypothetical protein